MIAQNRAPPYRSSRTGNANSGTDDSRAGRCLCGRFFAWVNEWAKRLAGSAVSAGGAAVLCRRTRSEFGTSSFSKQSETIGKGKIERGDCGRRVDFSKDGRKKADGGREMALTDEKTERKNDAGERVNKAADGHAACRGHCFLLGSRGGIDAQRRSSAFAVFCTCARRTVSSGFRDSSRR